MIEPYDSKHDKVRVEFTPRQIGRIIRALSNAPEGDYLIDILLGALYNATPTTKPSPVPTDPAPTLTPVAKNDKGFFDF